MAKVVLARHVAFLGKEDPASDYSWLRGRNAIPEQLFPLCEPLAEAASDAEAATALVTSTAGALYLLRAFRSGMDGAYRPVYCLDVGVVDSGESFLSQVDWLMLAYAALDPSKLDTLGESEHQTLRIGTPVENESRLDESTLDRLRLGVPISADRFAALEVLRSFPDSYRGIAWAEERDQRSAVRWFPAMRPFLAVGFSEPELSSEERGALEAVDARRPSPAEWQALDSVPPEQVREAVVWAARQGSNTGKAVDAAMATPGYRPEASAVPWLITFRRESMTGTRRLAAIRRDLGHKSLPDEVLNAACPELSRPALEVLRGFETGEPSEAGSDELLELAAAGYLDNQSVVPLQAWAGYVASSPVLERTAMSLLGAAGVVPSAARLALSLPAGEPPSQQQAEQAARWVRKFGLAQPLPELLRLLEEDDGRSVDAVVAFGAKAGGPAAALGELITRGAVPPAEQLAPADLVRGLRVLGRQEPSRDPGDWLVPLVLERRWAENDAILEAMDRGDLPSVDASIRGLIEVRRGNRGPIEGLSVAELRNAVGKGLASPEHVVPPADAEGFVTIASLWPETSALSTIFGGEGQIPNPCPRPWLKRLETLLSPQRAAAWIERQPADQRLAAGAWLAETLRLPAAMGALPADPLAALKLTAGDVRQHFEWLQALVALGGRMGTLQRLSQLAAGAALRDDDTLAARLVDVVLQDAKPKLKALCVHLLSGIGPFPRVEGIRAEELVLLAEAAEPVALVDAIFLSESSSLHRDRELIEMVLQRVHKTGAPCPERRYTQTQLAHHPFLASQLGRLPGWEAVAPGPAVRSAAVQSWARELGIDHDELARIAARMRESETGTPAAFREVEDDA